MSIVASPRFLPRVMAADALSCAATGALQLGLTDALAQAVVVLAQLQWMGLRATRPARGRMAVA